MAMGKLKTARKDYPAAIGYYKQAVEVVPMHDALAALTDLYQLTGKPEEAQKQVALVEVTHQLLKANGVRGDMQIAQFYAHHDRHLSEAIQEKKQKSRHARTCMWRIRSPGAITRQDATRTRRS